MPVLSAGQEGGPGEGARPGVQKASPLLNSAFSPAARLSLFTCLADLYGRSLATEMLPRLNALLDRFRPLLPTPIAGRPPQLSEADALLITYADQVQEPGIPPLRSLGQFAAAHLGGLFSAIHVLPFYPFSSDDGFSVKDYFAVEPTYGCWNDIAALGAHFELMFDAVFNHASVQGEWFKKFLAGDPEYNDFFVTISGNPSLKEVVRPRALPLLTEFTTAEGSRRVWTTFSSDQADLNFKNPAVLLRMLEVLLFYVAKGARFVRLDAIAFLWKTPGTTCLHLPQTHRIIQFFRAVLDQVAPQVRLITETNVPHSENVSYFGDGTNEAQLVYNFALPPLVLHAFHTGNVGKLTNWACSLSLPAGRVTFLNFLASHDGIGLNPARGILTEAEIETMVASIRRGGLVSYKSLPDGSRLPYELNANFLDALSYSSEDSSEELDARKFITAQALMLSLQGVPAVYFHSLVGSRGDFAAVRETGINRRINRQKLLRDGLERDLAQSSSLRGLIFRPYADLLRTRRAHAAFSPAAHQLFPQFDPRVFAVLRETPDGKDRMLCLHNVSADKVSLPGNSLLSKPIVLGPFEFRWISLG